MVSESYEPSYYAALGVPEDADGPAIGRAFMRGMRDAHPDAHAGGTDEDRVDAESRARLLTEAHGVLTGPDRAGYDARLAEWRATRPVEDEPMLPPGAPDVTVLPLTRNRWLRGGRLTPVVGGSPIDVPAGVAHDEVLVYDGRGAPRADGHPGDLHVHVVHVDRNGDELPEGHDARSSGVGNRVRRMGPGDVALAVLGLLVLLAAAAVVLKTR